MLLIEALGTGEYKGEAMLAILSKFMEFNNGDAIFTADSRGFDL